MGPDDGSARLPMQHLVSQKQQVGDIKIDGDGNTVLVHQVNSTPASESSLVSPRLEAIESALRALSEHIARSAGVDGRLVLAAAAAPIEPPRLVSNLAHRTEDVSRLLATIKVAHWVALHGPIGSGKTQLAGLVVQQSGLCRAWVRLRGVAAPCAHLVLEEICVRLVGARASSDRSAWWNKVGAAIGRGGLFVIDDLARVDSETSSGEFLLDLATACSQHGGCVVTTSPFPLPGWIRERMGPRELQEVDCPPFDNAAIESVLRSHGAPEAVLTASMISALATVTRRHAALVVAAARYELVHGWRPLPEALAALLSNQYAQEISRDTVQKLIDSVPGEACRQMLYRLRLVGAAFGPSEAAELGTAPPAIQHPMEKVLALDGLWLQAEGAARWTISPLIDVLPGLELSPRTEKACHQTLARLLLSKAVLDPFEVARVVRHYCAAGDVLRGAATLASIYTSFLSKDGIPDREHYAAFLASIEIPKLKTAGFPLYLRALQAAVWLKGGLTPPTAVLNDIDALLGRVTGEERWGIVALGVTLSPHIAKVEPLRAIRYAREAVRAGSQLPSFFGEPIESLLDKGIEALLWFPTSRTVASV